MAAITTYEANQNFNSVTRYLHSIRFGNLMACLAELSYQITDRPIEVLELGCNTGRAYEAMDARFRVNYRGVDLDEEVIAIARQRYAGRNNCTFLLADAADPQFVEPGSADIVVALETLEHIPEATVVRIVENVAGVIRPRLFIVSVPIEIGPAIWVKYLGSKLMGYRRSRTYTWRDAFWAGLYNLNRVPTHGVQHRGFNWYWLEQTVRHNAQLRESRSMPFRWLPKWLAPSVMFIAEPIPTGCADRTACD
jgi:SAM-dependent methyltransferase